MKPTVCLIVALFAVLGEAVSAQSLGELARKEKERREKLAGHKVRSFSDQNVGRSAPLPPTEEAPPAEGAAASESAPAAAPERKPEEDPAKTPGYWRDRLGAIQKRVSELEAQLNRPGFDQDPTNLRRRQSVEEDLKKARADLTGLQEEARKKGVPAGWLR